MTNDINFSKYTHPTQIDQHAICMTNPTMNDLYIQFHTNRKKNIEELTEQRFKYLVVDGCLESPSTRKDAFYWAMEQIPEEKQLEEFANLIIHECCRIVNIWTDEDIAEDKDVRPVRWIKRIFGIDPWY
jgi:hypothetical protein